MENRISNGRKTLAGIVLTLIGLLMLFAWVVFVTSSFSENNESLLTPLSITGHDASKIDDVNALDDEQNDESIVGDEETSNKQNDVIISNDDGSIVIDPTDIHGEGIGKDADGIPDEMQCRVVFMGEGVLYSHSLCYVTLYNEKGIPSRNGTAALPEYMVPSTSVMQGYDDSSFQWVSDAPYPGYELRGSCVVFYAKCNKDPNFWSDVYDNSPWDENGKIKNADTVYPDLEAEIEAFVREHGDDPDIDWGAYWAEMDRRWAEREGLKWTPNGYEPIDEELEDDNNDARVTKKVTIGKNKATIVETPMSDGDNSSIAEALEEENDEDFDGDTNVVVETKNENTELIEDDAEPLVMFQQSVDDITIHQKPMKIWLLSNIFIGAIISILSGLMLISSRKQEEQARR